MINNLHMNNSASMTGNYDEIDPNMSNDVNAETNASMVEEILSITHPTEASLSASDTPDNYITSCLDHLLVLNADTNDLKQYIQQLALSACLIDLLNLKIKKKVLIKQLVA